MIKCRIARYFEYTNERGKACNIMEVPVLYQLFNLVVMDCNESIKM